MEENAILDSSQINIENLLCPGNNRAQFLCCSKNCDHCALVCGGKSCTCVSTNHIDCDFSYSDRLFQKVMAKRGKLSSQLEKAIAAIDKVYEEAIEKISKDRESLMMWKENYGLSMDQARLLISVRENRKQEITGGLICKVKSSIHLKRDNHGLTQLWVEKNWQRQKVQFDKVFSKFSFLYEDAQIEKFTIYEWDGKHKGRFMEIADNAITQTKDQNSGQRFAMMSSTLNNFKPVVWAIKMRKIQSWIGVGICLQKNIIGKQYHFEPTTVAHGSYMLSNNMYTWSPLSPDNSISQGFNFKTGDTIYMRYDPIQNTLKFNKNIKEGKFKLKVAQSPQDNVYCPCVNLSCHGDSVQIADITDEIDWSTGY